MGKEAAEVIAKKVKVFAIMFNVMVKGRIFLLHH